MSPDVDVSIRDLRNHTADVMRAIAEGTTTYLTRHGERIAKITPMHPITWSDHVHAVLGDAEPYESGLTDLLEDDDQISADLERDEPARTNS